MNMRIPDRILRYFGGVLLLTWAVAGGPLWAFLGVLPLATAAWGFCPVYHVFKSGSGKSEQKT